MAAGGFRRRYVRYFRIADPSRTTSLATARKLYAQAAFTEFACFRRNIRCMEANNSSIKAFIGISRARGVDQKASMVAAIRAYGYEAGSHDEADAIAIRLYAIAKLFPKQAAVFGLDMGLLGAAADNG